MSVRLAHRSKGRRRVSSAVDIGSRERDSHRDAVAAAVMGRDGREIIGVVRFAEVQAACRRAAISVAAPGSGSALSHEAAVLRQVRQPLLDPLPLTRRSPFE